jgi:membrane-bound inhibitor of C-type lysozyme
MNTWCRRILVVPAAFIVLAPDGASGQAAQTDAASLAGSSWQLVQFRGGDDKILTPQVRTSGIYEFEPFGGGTTAIRSPVASKGPVTYQCDPPARGADSLRATFYETTPPMVLLERSNETRPAFLVRSAGGAKYEGNDVMFWEARGEASVTWSSDEVKCRPR